ncbi:hypothetical protein [Nocardia noduli]|uniref:hypothetical protein n=1 Tax=Nocardia noduli TaxID=2815722 RepID=UPI001C21D3DC|nr:hypothetical protein [Nocardia noduli]
MSRRRSPDPAAAVTDPAAPLPDGPARARRTGAAPSLRIVPDVPALADPDADADAAAVAAFRRAAVAENTRLTYATGWRQFDTWCTDRGRDPLPASPDTVTRFAGWQARRRDAEGGYAVKASTITTWCAAIGAVHAEHGYTDPAADPAVRETLRGIRRERRKAREPLDRAAPLMTADLTRIVTAIAADAHTWREQMAAARDIALLVVMFAGSTRRGEALGIQVRDLHIDTGTAGDYIDVELHGTKTNAEGIDHFILTRGTLPMLCPWCVLMRWLTLLADYDTAHARGGPRAGKIAVQQRLRADPGPLADHHRCDRALPRFPATTVAVFRALGRAGLPAATTPMTGQALGQMIHTRARQAGYPPEQAAKFRGHSARAGATTQALDNGATYREVMNMTRHRQVDTVRKYDRAPIDTANATRHLGL